MKDNVIFITSREQLRETIKEVLNENQRPDESSFDKDRLTWIQTSKFTNMSIPTLRKRVKEGIFKIHGSGRKNFFLKSEIIEALKSKA